MYLYDLFAPDLMFASRTLVRTSLLQAIPPFLTNIHAFHESSLSTRLVQVLLKLLAPLLPDAAAMQNSVDIQTGGGARGKGKKRARGYEGDEILKSGNQVTALSLEQSEEVVAAVNGERRMLVCHAKCLQLTVRPAALVILLRGGFVAQPTVTTAYRTALTLTLVLQQRTAHSLSVDTSVHGRLLEWLTAITVDLSGRGMSGWAAQGLPLVVSTTIHDKVSRRLRAFDRAKLTFGVFKDACRSLEVALHPRVPPLLRAIPEMDSFVLFRGEETKAQREARETLRLDTAHSEAHPPGSNVVPFSTHVPDVPVNDPNLTPRVSQAQVVPVSAATAYTEPASVDMSMTPIPAPRTTFASTIMEAKTTSVEAQAGEAPASRYVPPAWSVGPTTTSSPKEQVGKTNAAPDPPLQPPIPIEVDDDDDEGEDIPTIDMRSDSDSD